MSIVGLVISLVMTLVLMAYVLLPLVMSSNQRATLDRQRERVLAYYERILTNIRDLDEDHITGKIAIEEYTIEREGWVQRGIKLLKVIDELESKKSLVDSSDDAEIDSAIEAAIAEKKQQVQEVS